MKPLAALWRRARWWRAATVAAAACTVLAFTVRPGMQGSAPPMAQPSAIPPIPTGSSYQSPAQPLRTPAPADVSIMQPVAPVAALPPKIAPSRALEPDKLPPAKEETPREFGIYRGEDKSRLRPSLPAQSQQQPAAPGSNQPRR